MSVLRATTFFLVVSPIEPSIVGYLWIDSKKLRTFKHLWADAGKREEWGAAMHFIQAITDAVAVALSNETFRERTLQTLGSHCSDIGGRVRVALNRDDISEPLTEERHG